MHEDSRGYLLSAVHRHCVMLHACAVEQAIESFIRFLAVERGLSDNYQLSTQRSLTELRDWCAATETKIDRSPRAVTLAADQRISRRSRKTAGFRRRRSS